MTIPIFPLKTVLFPGGILPLRIFEQRYMDMAKICLRDNTSFGVALIKEGEETGAPTEPEEIGCLIRILDWDMQQLGVLNLKTEGVQRFRTLNKNVSDSGLISAHVAMIAAEPRLAITEEHEACVTVLKTIIAQAGAEHFQPDQDFTNASWVSYRLAEVLPIKFSIKQKMLEINDSTLRLQILHKFLKQQGLLTQQ